MSADLCTLNPLYSDNRLKLGVFGANVSNGCSATTAPGHLEMNWPNSRDIVTIAGTGSTGTVGSGGQATEAEVSAPARSAALSRSSAQRGSSRPYAAYGS